MRLISLFSGFVFVFSVNTVYAQQNDTPPPLHPAVRIVVIGSSTAAGAGANPPDSAWVNRYRAYLKTINPDNEVVNLALGGYNTYRLMPSGLTPPANRPAPDTLRNITRALALEPDAVVVNLPSNDAAAGYGRDEQLANFETIAYTAWLAGVPVWVCTTQPRRLNAERVRIQLLVRDTVLARFKALALNFWEGLSQPDGMPASGTDAGDGIHLNNAGHRLLFRRVQEMDIPDKLQAGPWLHTVMDSLWAAALPLCSHPLRSQFTLKKPPATPQEALLLPADHPLTGVRAEIRDPVGRVLLQRRDESLPQLLRDAQLPGGVYWFRHFGADDAPEWVKWIR